MNNTRAGFLLYFPRLFKHSEMTGGNPQLRIKKSRVNVTCGHQDVVNGNF